MLTAILATGVAAAATDATTSTADVAKIQAAEWMPRNIVVQLHALPKRYSCDALWYKFHGVLLQLGARPDMQIITYRCGPQSGSIGYSPGVQLQFSIPVALTGADQRWADVQAQRSTIRLQPGSPSILDSSDCELLRQMNEMLLPALASAHTVDARLACETPGSKNAPAFSLTVDALTSQSVAPRVAGVSAPVRPS